MWREEMLMQCTLQAGGGGAVVVNALQEPRASKLRRKGVQACKAAHS
jgi:hypothetical protein